MDALYTRSMDVALPGGLARDILYYMGVLGIYKTLIDLSVTYTLRASTRSTAAENAGDYLGERR